MRKRLSLLLLLAVMAVEQSFAISLYIGGDLVSPGDFTDIKSEHAKAYDSELGSYKMWMDMASVDGVDVYTLHLQNVQVFNTSGSSGIDMLLGNNETAVVVVESTSKIMAQSDALLVSSGNNTTDLTIQGSYPLILKSFDYDALYLSNNKNGCNLYLDGFLEVSNTSNIAEDMRAAIHFNKPGDIQISASGYLKAKSNYAGIVGVKKLTNPGNVNTNFEFAYFDEDGVYASVDPSAKDKMMTDWCYANYYEVPVKVAGTQVLSAHSWGEAGIESPYITKGTVKYNEDWGYHNIYLDAAEINIPEEVTDVPGILIAGEWSRIMVRSPKGVENGHLSYINVPGGDGIRIAGNEPSPIRYTELTQDDDYYYRYLNIKAKTGINIDNQSSDPYSCEVTRKLIIRIPESETGIKVWGNAETIFRYETTEGADLTINSTGNAVVLGNDMGTGTEAVFAGEGEVKITSDGDALSVYNSMVRFDGAVEARIESTNGAAINGNKSNSHLWKDSKDSWARLVGKTGVINDVFFVHFADGAGEIVQEENADDAKLEKLNDPFWTYVQNGQPYAKPTIIRYVQKLFQVGDYVLDDHNENYFSKKVPGVAWDPWSKILYLTNANIKATGAAVGLKPLEVTDSKILLSGDNVIEAEGIALQSDKSSMEIWSRDGKGKLILKSTGDKGLYNLNGCYMKFTDITLDITAAKEAVWNEDGEMRLIDCMATFTGNGGGYFGAQTTSYIYLDNSFLTCTGSEAGGNINPSFWGYNDPRIWPVDLLTSGYVLDTYSSYPESWVYKTATGMKTGETIQFGLQPDDLYYYININGIELTGAAYKDIRPAELNSGKISYDPVERELILDNVDMDAASIFISSTSKCNKVKLIGDNKVYATCGSPFFKNEVPITIYSEDGTGKLTFSGSSDPSVFHMQANLTIKNCTVDLTNTDLVAVNGNDHKLTVDRACALFNGKTGSVINISELAYDPDTYFPETSITAPEGAVYNKTTKQIEVDGNLVKDETVAIRFVERYKINIAGEYMNADNCADFASPELKSGKISYNPETNVLTFENIELTGYFSSNVEDLTIMLVGNKNQIKETDAFFGEKSTIKSADGKGVLSISSSGNALYSQKDLTIEDCTVRVKSEGGTAIRVYGGNLIVNNASIRAEGVPSIAARDLILGEGLEITSPEGALFDKAIGYVVVNNEPTTDEVNIGKSAIVATTVPVTVSNVGAAGFSSTKTVDFTGSEVSAWIATGFYNGNVLLSRVTKVPAGTGVYLKGVKGKEIKTNVPIISDNSYYSNMFKAVTADRTIPQTEDYDFYTTYYFATDKNTGAPTFYPTPAEGKALKANKMYLRMQTKLDPNDVAGELTGETVEVTVGKAGAAGFSLSDKSLDFTGSKISAWVATGYSGGNILLSRVYAVPAGMGVYLKGKAGEVITEKIPVTTQKSYFDKPCFQNLFRATGSAPVTIYPEAWGEGGLEMRTLYFAQDKITGAPTFYPIDSSGKELKENKMYLTLPKAFMPDPAPAREMGMEFLEDDVLMLDTEATGIIDIDAEQLMSSDAMQNARGTFDLQGRRVDASMVKKGVYIQNGRKVMKK